MTKPDTDHLNPLHERTLKEKLDGPNDKQDGMGKPSPVTRKKRPPKTPPTKRERVTASEMPLADRHVAMLSTDLHARDRKGNKIPTLAERVRAEGYKAQLAPKKPKAKPKGARR